VAPVPRAAVGSPLMLSWIPSGFRRPRAIFLSAMIVVVAVLLGRNSRTQRESVSDQVSAWTERAVMAAQDSREDEVRELGGSEGAVAGTFAAWVRDTVPASMALHPKLSVRLADDSLFGAGSGAPTHTVGIELRGARAEVDVHWNGGSDGRFAASMLAFRVQASPATSAAPAMPGR